MTSNLLIDFLYWLFISKLEFDLLLSHELETCFLEGTLTHIYMIITLQTHLKNNNKQTNNVYAHYCIKRIHYFFYTSNSQNKSQAYDNCHRGTWTKCALLLYRCSKPKDKSQAYDNCHRGTWTKCALLLCRCSSPVCVRCAVLTELPRRTRATRFRLRIKLAGTTTEGTTSV